MREGSTNDVQYLVIVACACAGVERESGAAFKLVLLGDCDVKVKKNGTSRSR